MEQDSLASLCGRLLQSISTTAQRVAASAPQATLTQTQLGLILGELLQLDSVAASLRESAGPFDAGSVPCPEGVWQGTKTVPSNCTGIVDEVGAVLARGDPRRAGYAEEVGASIGYLARPLETGRRALMLAVQGLEMASGLDAAQRTGDSPPYVTTSITQEILAIKTRLAEDRDRDSNPIQTLVLSEFLEALQRYAEQQAGNVVTPATSHLAAAASSSSDAASMHSSSIQLQLAVTDHGSVAGPASLYSPSGSNLAADHPPLRPPPPPLPPIQGPTPSYRAVDIPFAPQRIDLRHVSFLSGLNHEPIEITCDHVFHEPRFAVSDFYSRIRFYRLRDPSKELGQSGTAPAGLSDVLNLNGIHMRTSPTAPVMAVATENSDVPPITKEKSVGDPVTRKRELAHDTCTLHDAVLMVYDYARGTKMWQGWWDGIRPFGFSPDGQMLALRGIRNRVEVVCALRWGGKGVVQCHTDEVVDARFLADGSGLVTMSRDGTLRVTNTNTWQGRAKLEVAEWRNPIFLAVSSRTDNVIVSVWGRKVYLWNPDTGALSQWSLDGGDPEDGGGGRNDGGTEAGREGWPLAVSPDLRFMCCRTDQGTDIREVGTGRVLCRMGFGQGMATAAAFSDDGRFLALGRSISGHHGYHARERNGRVDFWELIE